MAQESVTRLTDDSELVGTDCTHCHQQLAVGDEVVICPRCKSAHHVQCWKDNFGCARRGCPQVAEAVLPDKPIREESGDNKYLEKERPKMKWKIALGILAAAVLVAAMTVSGPDPAAGRTKIVLMTQGGVRETDFFQSVADEFNKAHPEWYLESMVTPFGGYDQKLVVLLGAREAPDIFVAADYDRYRMFAERGGFLSLDQYLKDDPALRDKLFPEGLEKLQVNGHIYGVPHPYRPDIFGIYALTEHPDVAWQTLVTVIERIQSDWPEELRVQKESNEMAPLFPGPLSF